MDVWTLHCSTLFLSLWYPDAYPRFERRKTPYLKWRHLCVFFSEDYWNHKRFSSQVYSQQLLSSGYNCSVVLTILCNWRNTRKLTFAALWFWFSVVTKLCLHMHVHLTQLTSFYRAFLHLWGSFQMPLRVVPPYDKDTVQMGCVGPAFTNFPLLAKSQVSRTIFFYAWLLATKCLFQLHVNPFWAIE